jgi:hypothetical protein
MYLYVQTSKGTFSFLKRVENKAPNQPPATNMMEPSKALPRFDRLGTNMTHD